MQRCGEGIRKSGEPKMRRCKDAKLRRGFQKIWRVEDAKMQRCGEGFRKSGEPKMRRCEDAKMRRCGEGYRKSGELKMRRYEDVMLRQPPQYLPIQCHEDAKMQRCDDARPGQCPLSATCLFLHPPAAATDFAQVGQLSDHEAASSISMAKWQDLICQ